MSIINQMSTRNILALKQPKSDNTKVMEEVKQQVIPQLESEFPQITKNRQECRSRYMHVEYKGNTYTVIGTPTYEHNIQDGTYILQSISYEVKQGSVYMEDDSQNNITEKMPVDGNTNVKDLQDKLSKLMEQVKEKTERLKKLMDAISGNGNQLHTLGFEAVDPKSPDAVTTLAKQIEVATAKISELDRQIHEKNNEYQIKTERCYQQKNKAREIDAEFDKVKQLLNDLCDHYGIPNVISIKGMEAPDKKDLNSLISWYDNYINMQKENIEKINDAIKNTKGQTKEIEIDVVKYTDDESGEKYLESLKLKAKSLNEKYDKAHKLLNDLCDHYGIPNVISIKGMEAPQNKDTESLIKFYEKYLEMQKENIEKMNAAIDKLQNPDSPQLSAPSKEYLEEVLKRPKASIRSFNMQSK